jgi:hypothetical protein
MMPDPLSIIIGLIAGVAGGFAVGDLLKGFDLGPAQALVAGSYRRSCRFANPPVPDPSLEGAWKSSQSSAR